MKPRLLLVLCLGAVLLTSNVALSENEQKKQSKQPNQKVSSPSRATLPASKVQPARPPAQKAQLPAVQSPRAAPTQARTQPLKPQPTRPSVKQVRPGQPLRQPSGQPSTSKPPTIKSGLGQPVPPLIKLPAAKPKALATNPPSTSKSSGVSQSQPQAAEKKATGAGSLSPISHQKSAEPSNTPKKAVAKPSKVASVDEAHKGQVQPPKKEKPQARGKETGHKGDDKSAVASKEKSLSEQQKHQDDKSSNSGKSAAKTDDKGKSDEMYKDELKKAIAKEKGEKLGSKYDRMSQNELKDELARLKEKKADKPEPGDKYEKLSRNELRNAIEKEIGYKLDKKYDNMSKNELRNELASLKGKDKDKDKKADKPEPGDKYEKLSRNELRNSIEKELGHKLDKKYEKMSKNELRNELASLKEKDKKSAKPDPGNKYENLSRKELTDAIAKEKGEPLNDHYKRMSKNELANELASLKERSHQPTSPTHSSPQIQQPGQTGGASPVPAAPSSTQSGSQQELINRRDQLKAELLKKDGENVKEAKGLRDEIEKLNNQIVDNEKAQALNTGAGLFTSIKNPLGLAGWAASNINQIGIQGGSLLSDKFLSGKQKESVDNSIFKWRSATDIVSASTGDPTGSVDAVLMAQRKYLEMKRDDDMTRLNSLGQDPETRKLREDYHNLLQQIGNK
jgi:hypothetical protein